MPQTFKDYICENFQIPTLQGITSSWLEQREIKALVFDFDGVLGPDCSIQPISLYAQLLHSLSQEYPLAIYSNANILERELYIKKHFPQVHWIKIPPRKPNPQPLIDLSKKWSIELKHIAMIDDRLYTGGLAAFRASCRFIYITKPECSFFSAPVHTLLFKIIRVTEKFMLALSSKSGQEKNNHRK